MKGAIPLRLPKHITLIEHTSKNHAIRIIFHENKFANEKDKFFIHCHEEIF